MSERDTQRHHRGKPGSRRTWRLGHGIAKGDAPGKVSPPEASVAAQAALPEAVLARIEAGEPYFGVVAPEGFVQPLLEELERPYVAEHEGVLAADGVAVLDRLVLVPGSAWAPAWGQSVWPTVSLVRFDSVKDAATKLRQLNRNWYHRPFAVPSRGDLIAQALPHVSFKTIRYGESRVLPPLGGFALMDSTRLLACPGCTSPYPDGELRFEENHEAPPSRAYLKLWELFTRLGKRPRAGERCVDLGASPGGWSWVLAELGAEVVAVDKADLAEAVKRMPGVSLRRESAFGIDPVTVGAVDWLFSDIICYPDRLLSLVRRWMESGLVRNWVCSLKLQGTTDHDTIREFAAIEGSHLVHLSVNRHELTWCLLAPETVGGTHGDQGTKGSKS